MSYQKSQNFDRGEYYPGPNATVNPADPVLVSLEGQEKNFEDRDYGAKGQPYRGQTEVVCRAVRNASGITLLPKQAVLVSTTNPGQVTGLAGTDAPFTAIVDEFLPAAGVPNGALFYVVIRGRTKALAAAAITAGSDVGSATGGNVSSAAATSKLGVCLAAVAGAGDVFINLRPNYR